MIEALVKAFSIQEVGRHPWVLAVVAVLAAPWFVGRRKEARDEAALKAKRQEAVDLMARLRDRRATGPQLETRCSRRSRRA